MILGDELREEPGVAPLPEGARGEMPGWEWGGEEGEHRRPARSRSAGRGGGRADPAPCPPPRQPRISMERSLILIKTGALGSGGGC